MSANTLAANDDKTHIVVIRRKGKEQELVINIGDKKIKESPNEKLLGMWVESNLGWSTHLAQLERKLKHRLFNLRRLSEQIPLTQLKTIADGIFMSILRYGLPIYCPLRMKEEDPHHSSIDKIKVVFNDCLRLLTNNKRNDRVIIKDMLRELGWISINQLCAETRLLEAWKTTLTYLIQDTAICRNIFAVTSLFHP